MDAPKTQLKLDDLDVWNETGDRDLDAKRRIGRRKMRNGMICAISISILGISFALITAALLIRSEAALKMTMVMAMVGMAGACFARDVWIHKMYDCFQGIYDVLSEEPLAYYNRFTGPPNFLSLLLAAMCAFVWIVLVFLEVAMRETNKNFPTDSAIATWIWIIGGIIAFLLLISIGGIKKLLT
jgi:hypothetical protein